MTNDEYIQINDTINVVLNTNPEHPTYVMLGLEKFEAEYIWHFIRHRKKHYNFTKNNMIPIIMRKFKDAELIYALIVLGETEGDGK